jgi:hypothetical protein
VTDKSSTVNSEKYFHRSSFVMLLFADVKVLEDGGQLRTRRKKIAKREKLFLFFRLIVME